MESRKEKETCERRDFLGRILGAGTAVAAVACGSRLFAGNFLRKCPTGKPHEMVYDPERQVMVDPATGRPIADLYAAGTTTKEWTAIVTPGGGPNGPGPKGDGKTDTSTD